MVTYVDNVKSREKVDAWVREYNCFLAFQVENGTLLEPIHKPIRYPLCIQCYFAYFNDFFFL